MPENTEESDPHQPLLAVAEVGTSMGPPCGGGGLTMAISPDAVASAADRLSAGVRMPQDEEILPNRSRTTDKINNARTWLQMAMPGIGSLPAKSAAVTPMGKALSHKTL